MKYFSGRFIVPMKIIQDLQRSLFWIVSRLQAVLAYTHSFSTSFQNHSSNFPGNIVFCPKNCQGPSYAPRPFYWYHDHGSKLSSCRDFSNLWSPWEIFEGTRPVYFVLEVEDQKRLGFFENLRCFCSSFQSIWGWGIGWGRVKIDEEKED